MTRSKSIKQFSVIENGAFEGFVPRSRLDFIAARSYGMIERLAARIAWCLEHRSKSTRLVLGLMFFVLLIASYRHVAHAQGAPHLLQDEINQAYNVSFSFNILQNALTVAQYLFATLAALTVIVNVLAYYIKNQSVIGLGQVVLTSILRLGIPFVIIGLAPTVLPAISLIGLQLAGDVSGNANSYSSYGVTNTGPAPDTLQAIISDLYNNTFGAISGNAGVTVSPSNIAQFGENIGFTIIDKAQCAVEGGTYDPSVTGSTQPCMDPNPPSNTNATYQSNSQVMQVIIILAIGIIGTFVFIAVELVIAYLQVYLVLPVAAFSLGFLGSPATRQYGSGYWTLVVGSLLKFVTIVFTVGFAITIANDWASQLGSISFNKMLPTSCSPSSTTCDALAASVGAMKVTIGYSMASFSLLYIVRVLPSLFAGLLTGNTGSADGNQAEYQTQNLGSRMGPTGGGSSLPKSPGSPGTPTSTGGTTFTTPFRSGGT